MSGTERKSCSEVLPLLFNLLVENADRIVDDTSLERILEWLKNVCETDRELQKLLQCGTVEFISREQVFSNPESSGFFLRLFGFLVAKAELFRSFSCARDGDFLSRFLDKPKSEPGLWNEGIVRHGYFQALISLTEHEDGVAWLRIGGSRRESLVHPASMIGPIIISHEIFKSARASSGGGGGLPLCATYYVHGTHSGGGGAYLRGGLNIIEDFSNGICC